MQTSVLAPPVPRLHGIDGLRGILACSVMLYHYTVWAGIDVGLRFSGLLSAVAFYAVEAFFVISGMSLAFVYERTDFSRPQTVGTFFVRRFFRIAPLFYAVLAATLVLKWAAVHVLHTPGVAMPSLVEVIENLSLLFGLVDPTQSLVIAGWSIGIEMVFYLLFPPLMWLMTRRDVWRPLLLAGSAVPAAVFAFVLLDPRLDFASQSACYSSVANHLLLFVAGMLLVRGTSQGQQANRVANSAWIVLSLGLFAALSQGMRDTDLVTGWRRGALLLVTIGGCAAVARRPASRSLLSRMLERLGEWSYSIYLCHFLVFTVLQRLISADWRGSLVVGSALATIGVGRCSYRWLEVPMIRVGKRITERLWPAPPKAAEMVTLPAAPARRAA